MRAPSVRAVVVSEGDRRFGAQLNSAVEDPRREQDPKGTWNGRWMAAAGAFSLSFAASTMSVAYGKERVADKFAPKDVVLYQYDACPFCNKVKGKRLFDFSDFGGGSIRAITWMSSAQSTAYVVVVL